MDLFTLTDPAGPVTIMAADAADAFTRHWGMSPDRVTDATELGYADPLGVQRLDVDATSVRLSFERIRLDANRLVLEVSVADIGEPSDDEPTDDELDAFADGQADGQSGSDRDVAGLSAEERRAYRLGYMDGLDDSPSDPDNDGGAPAPSSVRQPVADDMTAPPSDEGAPAPSSDRPPMVVQELLDEAWSDASERGWPVPDEDEEDWSVLVAWLDNYVDRDGALSHVVSGWDEHRPQFNVEADRDGLWRVIMTIEGHRQIEQSGSPEADALARAVYGSEQNVRKAVAVIQQLIDDPSQDVSVQDGPGGDYAIGFSVQAMGGDLVAGVSDEQRAGWMDARQMSDPTDDPERIAFIDGWASALMEDYDVQPPTDQREAWYSGWRAGVRRLHQIRSERKPVDDGLAAPDEDRSYAYKLGYRRGLDGEPPLGDDQEHLDGHWDGIVARAARKRAERS